MSGERFGYLHPEYAASFADVADPVELPRSGGWILERSIPGSPLRDATGCYPLFCCADWSRLGEDISALAPGLVTLTLVTDPAGDFDPGELAESFDFVREYKRHYVADLGRADELPVTDNHRESVARARTSVHVRWVPAPAAEADSVWRLYDELVERRGVTGIRRFSRSQIDRQLRVPGSTLFTASKAGEVVSFLHCYVSPDVAYAHLAASSERGYELRAAFAVYETAVHHLRERTSLFVLGAAAGTEASASDAGLARFKEGFATETRPVHLCGRVLDASAYEQVAGRDAQSDFFPAYRTSPADR